MSWMDAVTTRMNAMFGQKQDASMIGSGPMPHTTANKRSRYLWTRPAQDARGDTLPHLRTAWGQSRALAQTNAIAFGALRTNLDRVVGTGLALSATPNASILGWTPEQAQAWKNKVQSEFSLWADSTDCDWAGKHNFYELQAVVLWGALASGDIFTLMPDAASASTLQPYKLRLQLIEADRIGNPLGKLDSADMAGGIRFANGRPSAAHIYNHHPGGSVIATSIFAGEWVDFVGASGRRRLLHHARLLRPDQPRGVPYLTPVMDDIKRLGDYADAEIEAAVISAYYTVFIETEGAELSAVHGAAETTAEGDEQLALGSGAIIGLNPGEKISTANPGRPNPNFEAFYRAVVRNIGMGLGLPVELLTKEFNASYSSSKAAILDAWMYLRGVRTWLSRSLCQPVYETWLTEAVILGRVSAPSYFSDPLMRWAYTRASWPGDSMGSINPKDEVAAYTAAIDARLITRERAEWELFGTDWYDTFAGKKTEQSMLKAADLLPVPKAGAAVQQTQQDTTK